MGVKSLAGGLNLQEMLDAGSQIKGLLIFADDLVNHLPLPSMIERLKGLEFLLVADRFVTETTRIAHYILPLPLLAESEGTLTNCEGRVQKIRPALKPKGESRNLREVLTLLSEALGNRLPASSDAEVRKEIGMTIPGYQRITNDSDLDSASGTLLPRPAKIVSPPQSLETARGVKEGAPYVLFIPNTLYAWNRNQMILESPVLNIEYPADRLALRMCSKDARELKVRMGEKVRIKSERGEAQIEVEPDENLPQRTLVLPSHFISIVAPLTGNGELDSGTRSRYYPDVPVTLEKL
jgi:predicted molibdopterin-dependent oxidoreductase YjgC